MNIKQLIREELNKKFKVYIKNKLKTELDIKKEKDGSFWFRTNHTWCFEVDLNRLMYNRHWLLNFGETYSLNEELCKNIIKEVAEEVTNIKINRITWSKFTDVSTNPPYDD